MLATVVGTDIIVWNCPNGIQNWNAWVGSATGDKVSTSPKQELSDQSYKGMGYPTTPVELGFLYPKPIFVQVQAPSG
jgi:hypothetical protein